jgi:Restriction endonuclease XhoI
MDGFQAVLKQVVIGCGLPESSVFLKKTDTVLPGYFRATKNWDVLILKVMLGRPDDSFRALSDPTSVHAFFRTLAAHLLAA